MVLLYAPIISRGDETVAVNRPNWMPIKTNVLNKSFSGIQLNLIKYCFFFINLRKKATEHAQCGDLLWTIPIFVLVHCLHLSRSFCLRFALFQFVVILMNFATQNANFHTFQIEIMNSLFASHSTETESFVSIYVHNNFVWRNIRYYIIAWNWKRLKCRWW